MAGARKRYARVGAVAAAPLALLVGLAAGGGSGAAGPLEHDMVVISGSGFRIDRHEVTVGQFRRFAEATGRITEAEKQGGGRQYRAGWEQMAGWTWRAPYGTPAKPDEPAVHVTWDEARDYCHWAGLRLPSDREWVIAAYTEARPEPLAPFVKGVTYPFPTGKSAEGANHLDAARPSAEDLGSVRTLDRGYGHVRARVSRAGVNGLYDMGGNVWEWVEDGGRGERITRGGSWWYGPTRMRREPRATKPKETAVVYIGFRCAAEAD